MKMVMEILEGILRDVILVITRTMLMPYFK